MCLACPVCQVWLRSTFGGGGLDLGCFGWTALSGRGGCSRLAAGSQGSVLKSPGCGGLLSLGRCAFCRGCQQGRWPAGLLVALASFLILGSCGCLAAHCAACCLFAPFLAFPPRCGSLWSLFSFAFGPVRPSGLSGPGHQALGAGRLARRLWTWTWAWAAVGLELGWGLLAGGVLGKASGRVTSPLRWGLRGEGHPRALWGFVLGVPPRTCQRRLSVCSLGVR